MTRLFSKSFPLSLAFAAFVAAFAQSPTYLIDSIGGSNSDPSGAGALSFEDIRGITADTSGNLYVSDSARHRVVRISPTGAVRTIAGTGVAGFSGDNGPGESAQLNLPYGVAVDSQGALYIADLGNARVRRLAADGSIRTVAGGGITAPAAGVTATSLLLRAPRNVAVDAPGNLYISDFQDHRVLRIGADGRTALVMGTGTAGPVTEGAASSATLNYPAGLSVDAGGALYIADSANHAIRRVSGNTIGTVRIQFSEQNINLPVAVAVDAAGNLYVASGGYDTVVRVTAAGSPTVIATGGARDVHAGAGGIVHSATASQVRRLSASGQWTPVTGGGAVSQLSLGTPDDVELEAGGSVLVADSTGNRVQRIAANGTPALVAGTGDSGFSGDGGQASAARLNAPQGVAVDRSGTIYISDSGNHRIRRVDASGIIRTVAGTGSAGNTYESRSALLSSINSPSGIAVDGNGEVYFSDTGNHMIRRLSAAGTLIPVAGNGVSGFRGDAASAVLAQLSSPKGLAHDLDGSLLVADSGNHRIRRISLTGAISTIAGNGVAAFAGDGRRAVEASLNQPAGVAVDAAGNIYIADSGNQRVRRIAADGTISTVAGSGVKGYSGDQGPALNAKLDTPVAIAAGTGGTIYLADRGNQRIRQLTLSPTSGGADSGDLRVVHAATLEAGPVAPGMLLAVTGAGIGPAAPAWSRLGPGVPLETVLGGTQVRFDGVAAPLLYAQDNMIHFQAPYRIADLASTKLEVVKDGVVKGQVTLVVASTSPGIFATQGGAGPAAAVNEDSTINGETAGVQRGATFQFFLTGEGVVAPQLVEGRLAELPYPSPAQPVAVRVGQQAAELVSASAAVTAPGLLQVVARVPSTAASGRQTLQVTVGSTPAQANVTIFVR